jgi:hypothetical protein
MKINANATECTFTPKNVTKIESREELDDAEVDKFLDVELMQSRAAQFFTIEAGLTDDSLRDVVYTNELPPPRNFKFQTESDIARNYIQYILEHEDKHIQEGLAGKELELNNEIKTFLARMTTCLQQFQTAVAGKTIGERINSAKQKKYSMETSHTNIEKCVDEMTKQFETLKPHASLRYVRYLYDRIVFEDGGLNLNKSTSSDMRNCIHHVIPKLEKLILAIKQEHYERDVAYRLELGSPSPDREARRVAQPTIEEQKHAMQSGNPFRQ